MLWAFQNVTRVSESWLVVRTNQATFPIGCGLPLNTQVPQNRQPSTALGRELSRRPLRVLCWVSAPARRLQFLHGQHFVISGNSGSQDSLKAMRGLVVSGVHVSVVHTPSRKHTSHPLTVDRAPEKRQCIAVHHIPACWFVFDRGCVASAGDRKRRRAYDASGRLSSVKATMLQCLQQRHATSSQALLAAEPDCRALAPLGFSIVSKAALNTLLPRRTTQQLTCLRHLRHAFQVRCTSYAERAIAKVLTCQNGPCPSL